ncbi:protein kinase [Collimonas sp.]|jgi:serine/threonine protein kinase|uniref:protein kinase domain-containing protein n=1 Tax=Collimonas sp. TaxID=1963772 RepID=UPI0037BF63C6
MQNLKPIESMEATAATAATAVTAVENCLPKGTRLADFEIIGVIGEGGFGIVYFAFDRSLRRMVAIKEYMPGAFAGRGPDQKVVVRSQRHRETFTVGLKSFIKEARLLAQFDHPALIKVYRFWEQNNTAYMAMRYYDGRTLKSVVQNSPAQITEAWLKSMLKPMLEALAAMYRAQILHRAISPDNIMIQKSGEAVLLDFGAARQIISDMPHSLTVILRPGYAPIEQYADDALMEQGPWTDIYSLSAVIYFAIVKTTPPSSVARMIKDPITRLQNGDYPGFSKEFLAAIDKGLALRPADRPQSIEEFRQLLDLELSLPMPDVDLATPISLHRQGKKSSGSTASPAALPQAAMTKNLLGSHLRWASAAAICALAGVAFFLFQPSPEPDVIPIVVHPGRVPLPTAAIATESGLAANSAEQVLDDETMAWETLKQQDSDATPRQANAFIQKYPDGKYRAQARGRLSEAHTGGVPENQNAAAPMDAKPAEARLADSTGIVTLAIKPWGKVVVDGSTKGVTPPLKKLVLAEGKHQVRVMNPNFPEHAVEINVTKKKPGQIDFDFSSPAALSTNSH